MDRELSHWNTIAAATTFAAYLLYFRGQTELAFDKAQALEELARSHGLGQWIPIAAVLAGRLMVQRGRPADGVAKAAGAFPILRGWRYGVAVPIVAEACGDAGEPAKGLEVLAEGIATAERDGMGYHLSEFYRLRGELLVKVSDDARLEAIVNVRRAVEIARSQQARSLELRAAMSLARLLTSQGQQEEARAVLVRTYDWFTEGFDTGDLKDARVALDEIR